MNAGAAQEFPHRRYNPLNGEWVLVSPQRTQRPWLGQVEPPPDIDQPTYDPNCYLCPGNTRAGGSRNPGYRGPFVFTNDFSPLVPDTGTKTIVSHPLLRAQGEAGTCRVVCFSPRHDLTLPQLPLEQVRAVVDVWAAQTTELGASYRWVQVFENKGAMMGCSNPHPHCQIWAGTALPNLPTREDEQQKRYYQDNAEPLLLAYACVESAAETRVVFQNEHWLVLVPFWAVWPFETLLLPRRHVLRLPDLSAAERDTLALALKHLLSRYDNLFQVPFPYSMGWHGAPMDRQDYAYWQLHAHFYPPLLRSATVKKFMVGYEMLAEAQRDLTAEQAAEQLRQLSDVHYSQRGE